MRLLPGVYTAKKKNGTLYYRSSITYRNKHISLGSFQTETAAGKAYQEAYLILFEKCFTLETYQTSLYSLSFEKWIVLINFRDNHMYIKNPIYLKKRYFIYYITEKEQLKFDVDDLFYYSEHKIIKRGGHLFVSDFGMQVNILSRYGIKNYAVAGKDYRFSNGDNTDYRYGNIEIINKYHGVTKCTKNGISTYVTKIHIRGNTVVGRYPTETEAAIAYNKAAELLWKKGIQKKFPVNYIVEIDKNEYLEIYNKIRISKHI